MSRFILVMFAFLACNVGAADPQFTLQTGGTLVVIPAVGSITHANDQVVVTFMLEEQDKDKGLAASRVNQKMKQGAAMIQREDPQAKLKTRGYYTYPVYAEEPVPRRDNRLRQPAGWRVGQYLEVTTMNLKGLPKTVAAVQNLLALNGLQFGLADATGKMLDAQRIAAAYANLTERIAAIASAMGRNVADAVLQSVDFEGSGAYEPQDAPQAKMMTMRAAGAEQVAVEEPSFEPGETTLQMQIVGKVKFK